MAKSSTKKSGATRQSASRTSTSARAGQRAKAVAKTNPSRSTVKKSAKSRTAPATTKKAPRAINRATKATSAAPQKVNPPAVADGRPRRNQAGLTARELEHFREMLLAKRRELVGDMSSMEKEALRSSSSSNLSNLPMHMADVGTDNYEQEFTLGLMEKDRKLLREINVALAKIQDGTYGICEGTGKPISKARLEVQPWARYSIEYARQMEKNPGR